MRAVYVHAEAAVPLDQLNPEDRDVPGVYQVILNSSVPEDALASAALDFFHSLVAVGTLDDFIFRVTNVVGEPLEEKDGLEGYEFIDMGRIEKL